MREQKPQTLFIEQNYLVLVSYDIVQNTLCSHSDKKYPNGCTFHIVIKPKVNVGYSECAVSCCFYRQRTDHRDVHFLVLRKLKISEGGVSARI